MAFDSFNSLTVDQKAAIVTALRWIGLWASLDIDDSGELLPKSLERLSAAAALLKIDLNSAVIQKYDNEDADEDLLLDTIGFISFNAKAWFVVETYMMLASAGSITQRAMQVTLMYCERIGISQDAYLGNCQTGIHHYGRLRRRYV